MFNSSFTFHLRHAQNLPWLKLCRVAQRVFHCTNVSKVMMVSKADLQDSMCAASREFAIILCEKSSSESRVFFFCDARWIITKCCCVLGYVSLWRVWRKHSLQTNRRANSRTGLNPRGTSKHDRDKYSCATFARYSWLSFGGSDVQRVNAANRIPGVVFNAAEDQVQAFPSTFTSATFDNDDDGDDDDDDHRMSDRYNQHPQTILICEQVSSCQVGNYNIFYGQRNLQCYDFEHYFGDVYEFKVGRPVGL